MRSIIIVGKQGSGKTTFANAILKQYHRPHIKRIINTQATDLHNFQSNPTLNEIAKITQDPRPHNLFIDETDNWFSYLSPVQKKWFVAYWAVARHYFLNVAVFVTRRYVQVPIQLRTSADEVFITQGITGYDLERIGKDRGQQLNINDFSEKNLPQFKFYGIK